MSMFDELRQEFSNLVVKEIFGDEWRPDRPLNRETMGMAFQRLLTGAARDEADYRKLAGKNEGLMRALELMDDAIRDLSRSTGAGRPE